MREVVPVVSALSVVLVEEVRWEVGWEKFGCIGRLVVSFGWYQVGRFDRAVSVGFILITWVLVCWFSSSLSFSVPGWNAVFVRPGLFPGAPGWRSSENGLKPPLDALAPDHSGPRPPVPDALVMST